MTLRDVKKIVVYWVTVAEEDLRVARGLLQSRKYAYCLFFCHLAIEKMLKAVVVARTKEHAPRTHNLPFLAGQAGFSLDTADVEFLVEMTRWNLEARYPSDLMALKENATPQTVKPLIKKTEVFLKWSRGQLQKN